MNSHSSDDFSWEEHVALDSWRLFLVLFFLFLSVCVFKCDIKVAVCDKKQKQFRFLYTGALKLTHRDSLKQLHSFSQLHLWFTWSLTVTLVIRNESQESQSGVWVDILSQVNWLSTVYTIHIQYPQVRTELLNKYVLQKQQAFRIKQIGGGWSSVACIIVWQFALHGEHS